MKKIICILVLMLSLISVVEGATVDNNPPILDYVSVTNKDYVPGEKVYLDLNVSDDVSGLNKGHVGLYSYSKGYVVYQMDIDNLNNPYFVIPDTAVGGNYILAFVMVSDNENNIRTYYNSVLKDVYKDNNFFYLDFYSYDLKIVTDTEYNDISVPVLESVVIENKEINYGDNTKLIVTASDDFGIDFISVTLSRDGFGYSDNINLTMEYDEKTRNFIGEIKPNKTGNYYVSLIQITDKYDNSSYYYYYKDGGKFLNDNSFELGREYGFVVLGENTDNDAPILESLKLNKEKVIAPSEVKVYVDASDVASGISSITVRFISQDYLNINKNNGTYSDGEVACDLYYDELTNKYVGTLSIDQYSVCGKYFIQKVVLVDNQNNSVVYINREACGNNYVGTELVDIVSFEVIQEFNYDLVTSTINKDIISQINMLDNDAVIMIDAINNYNVSKEIFDVIKGTNKTIYIEANGFQWVFNGMDILSSKDINVFTRTEIFVNENLNDSGKDYVAIVFPDNGELPGKALIRVKTDYTFRYAEGIDNLELYYYNETEDKYKKISDSVDLTEDGFYEFEITHNSTYLLSNNTISNELLTNSDDFHKEKNNNYIVYIIIGISLMLVLVVALIVIRRKNK